MEVSKIKLLTLICLTTILPFKRSIMTIHFSRRKTTKCLHLPTEIFTVAMTP